MRAILCPFAVCFFSVCCFSSSGQEKKDSVKTMKGVTVTAPKLTIQKLADRIVVNVDNSIAAAGGSVFELLQQSPGVVIDPNEQILLRGRPSVIIMINGKPSPLSGDDLAELLKSMPASSLERIDIISNPSSKYDAAGNAGIIDLRMKKEQRNGFNGTLTAGYGQGVFPKASTGSQLNYRTRQFNIFGSFNYAYRKLLNDLRFDRNFYDNGVFTGADKKKNYAKIPVNAQVFRLGADLFASKKTTLGFVVDGNYNQRSRQNNNNSLVIDNQNQPVSTFQTIALSKDNLRNILGNINIKHLIDTSGRELTADLDYGVYNSFSSTTNTTRYYKLDGSGLAPDYVLDGTQDRKLSIKTAKADYTHPIKKTAKIEAGIKTSFVSSDNDAAFFDMSTGTPKEDITKTNRFFYDENINAAYFNFYKEINKLNFQLGLRSEQTRVKTYQATGNIHWDSSYLKLFPSAFINYKLNAINTLGISVTRRIDRPGYAQLNPFLYLLDVTTFSTGNPSLLPQLSWNYELNYTWKELNVSLNYSHTRNSFNHSIVRFKDVFPSIPQDENVTVEIPLNLNASDYTGLSVYTPVTLNKWWNMINSGTLYYNHYYGRLANTLLDNGRWAFNISINNNFNLPKGWKAVLNGSYNSRAREGYMIVKPQFDLTAGLQKAILQGKGNIRLNITDIFWTNLPGAANTYANYNEKWNAYRETRVANITFTYRYGNNKTAAERKRSTGSEEEQRRAG